MKTIIDYLTNPMKIGVYHKVAMVDFTGLIDYMKEGMEKHKESYSKTKGPELPKRIFESRLSALSEALNQLDDVLGEETFFDSVMEAMRLYARLAEEPGELTNIFYVVREKKMPSGRVFRRRTFIRRRLNLFNSRIFPEIKDVVSVERRNVSERRWIFDVVSIKRKA